MNLADRFTGPGGRQVLLQALSRQSLLMGSIEAMNDIADSSEIIFYPAGEVLILQDGTDRHLLFILAGQTIISINGVVTSITRSAGTHIGEMALVDPLAVRSATVTATTDTVALKIEEIDFRRIADAHCMIWKGVAIEIASRLRQRNSTIQPGKRLVLLIHGIRTQAEWQNMIEEELSDSNTKVIPIKYDFFNLVRFWIPLGTRAKPIRETERKIQRAIYDHEGYEVVVIAHSFGTYAISKILERSPLIRVSKLILCGGIISRNFRWDKLPNRPKIVINDCGLKDLCPIAARWTTIGYGATGVFGFGTPEINDRFHNFAHSDFFNRDFVNTFWKPFVYSGIIEPSGTVRKTTPWWKSNFLTAAIIALALATTLIWKFINYLGR